MENTKIETEDKSCEISSPPPPPKEEEEEEETLDRSKSGENKKEAAITLEASARTLVITGSLISDEAQLKVFYESYAAVVKVTVDPTALYLPEYNKTMRVTFDTFQNAKITREKMIGDKKRFVTIAVSADEKKWPLKFLANRVMIYWETSPEVFLSKMREIEFQDEDLHDAQPLSLSLSLSSSLSSSSHLQRTDIKKDERRGRSKEVSDRKGKRETITWVDHSGDTEKSPSALRRTNKSSNPSESSYSLYSRSSPQGIGATERIASKRSGTLSPTAEKYVPFPVHNGSTNLDPPFFCEREFVPHEASYSFVGPGIPYHHLHPPPHPFYWVPHGLGSQSPPMRRSQTSLTSSSEENGTPSSVNLDDNYQTSSSPYGYFPFQPYGYSSPPHHPSSSPILQRAHFHVPTSISPAVSPPFPLPVGHPYHDDLHHYYQQQQQHQPEVLENQYDETEVSPLFAYEGCIAKQDDIETYDDFENTNTHAASDFENRLSQLETIVKTQERKLNLRRDSAAELKARMPKSKNRHGEFNSTTAAASTNKSRISILTKGEESERSLEEPEEEKDSNADSGSDSSKSHRRTEKSALLLNVLNGSKFDDRATLYVQNIAKDEFDEHDFCTKVLSTRDVKPSKVFFKTASDDKHKNKYYAFVFCRSHDHALLLLNHIMSSPLAYNGHVLQCNWANEKRKARFLHNKEEERRK